MVEKEGSPLGTAHIKKKKIETETETEELIQ